MQTERYPFRTLELHGPTLGELERDLDGASSELATAEHLKRSAHPLEDSSEQPTGEDLVSLESLDAPEREGLDGLAATPRGCARLHVTFAEDEDFSPIRGLELDHGMQGEL